MKYLSIDHTVSYVKKIGIYTHHNIHNIFSIYKRDLRFIFSGWFTLLATLALIVLPSLYAWFNIKAGRDPYTNTQGIKVAVVNQDKGTIFENTYINVGEKMVEELRNDDNMGRTFVSEKNAENGVKYGDYYAAIIISTGFSQDIVSLLEEKPHQAIITYLVNEKLNAIAPKITKKGASALQSQVDITFSELVNKTIFLYFNKLGSDIQASKPIMKKIADLFSGANKVIDDTYKDIAQAKIDATDMNNLLYKAKNDLPIIQNGIGRANSILEDSDYIVQYSRERLNTVPQIIESEFNSIASTMQTVDGLVNSQVAILGNIDTYANANLSGIKTGLTSAQTKIAALTALLQNINTTTSGALDPFLSQLSLLAGSIPQQLAMISTIETSVAAGKQVANSTLLQFKNGVSTIDTSARQISSNFHKNIFPMLQDSLNNLEIISNDTKGILNTISDDLPTIERILNNTMSGLSLSLDTMDRLEKRLPEVQNSISTINNKINILKNNKKIKEINKMLSFDPMSHSEFISNPVNLIEKKLFPIPNYGSAMSPFFTTLSLWVGALLLVSLFSTEPKRLDPGVKLSSLEKYFGRYFLFATIAMLQALFVSLGDKFILGTYVSDLPVFVLVSVFTSVVFSGIVFVLVSVFGNIGKVLAIIGLVLQLSGSGGTFPIEVTPNFFQILHPLLPFTYAIGAMRESVGGIISHIFWKDIFVLWIIFLFIMIIGISIKSYVNKYISIIEKSFHESGLAAHE